MGLWNVAAFYHSLKDSIWIFELWLTYLSPFQSLPLLHCTFLSLCSTNTNLSPHLFIYFHGYECVLPVPYSRLVPEEIRGALGWSPLKWVTGGCELPCRFWEPKSRSSARATCPLNHHSTKPAVQPLIRTFQCNLFEDIIHLSPQFKHVVPHLVHSGFSLILYIMSGHFEIPREFSIRDGTFPYSPVLAMFPTWLNQNIWPGPRCVLLLLLG